MENWTNLLSVKLNHQMLPGSAPSSIIYHKRGYNFTVNNYNYVMSELDSKWSNDTEKLSIFRATKDSDGNIVYFCEMEKNVFDFRERQYIKRYAVKELTEEEQIYLYTTFKNFLNKFYIESVDNFYDHLMTTLGDKPLVAGNLLMIRNELLRESDKYMLIDYPISDEERQQWITYRQGLRDITSQEAYPHDFVNIEIPVSPDAAEQFDILKQYINIDASLLNEIGPEFTNAGLQNMIKNFANAATKVEVLKALASMRIPMFVEQDMTAERIDQLRSGLNTSLLEINNYQSGSNEIGNESEWEDAMSYLDDKISTLNSKIAEFNLDFTLEDVISKLIEDTQNTIDAQTLVDEL